MWKDKKAGLKKFEPFLEPGRLVGQKQKQEQVLSGGQILGTQGKASDQTLPEAQRTQGIESIT